MAVQVLFGSGDTDSSNLAGDAMILSNVLGGSSQYEPEPMPVAGSFTNWFVRVITAPGLGKSYTFALRKNGSSTVATLTISGTDTTGSYTGTAVSFAAGDTITMRKTNTGSPANEDFSSAIEFTPNDGVSQIWANSSQSHEDFPNDGVAMNGNLGYSSNYTDTNVISTPGVITGMYLHANALPGAGKSRTFTYVKNGVLQDGSGGTVNTTVTITNASLNANGAFSLPIAAGDTITIRQALIGAPATGTWMNVSSSFVPTTAGTFMSGMTGAGADVSGGLRYAPPNRQRDVWAITSPSAFSAAIFIGGITTAYVDVMYVGISAAPGGVKSWTFTLYKNGVPTTLTVTVAGTATTGALSINPPIAIAPGDIWTVSSQSSGTPSSGTADQRISMSISLVPPPVIAPIPISPELGPQAPCDPSALVSNGGKGASGCNVGGIGELRW